MEAWTLFKHGQEFIQGRPINSCLAAEAEERNFIFNIRRFPELHIQDHPYCKRLEGLCQILQPRSYGSTSGLVTVYGRLVVRSGEEGNVQDTISKEWARQTFRSMVAGLRGD